MLFRGFRIAVSFNMPKARFHLSFEVTCPFCRLNFGSSVLNTVLTISVKHWLPSVLLFDLCQNPVHRAFGSSLVLPLSLIQAIADSHLYGSWGFLLHYSDLEFTSIFIFFFFNLRGLAPFLHSPWKQDGPLMFVVFNLISIF